MFGGPLELPKRSETLPCSHKMRDINAPSIQPHKYSHFARSTNSDYGVRYLHYKQRLKETLDQMSKNFANYRVKDNLFIKYFKYYEKKDLKRAIEKRVAEKLKIADVALEARRQRLIDMLSQEEKLYFYETVDQAQRGKEHKLAEMKEEAEKIRAKRESERLRLVEEKRFLQIQRQNEQLRTTLAKMHNVESKMVNLQQMRENEAKRESEREIDNFYHALMMKDIEEKRKREEQDAIKFGGDMKSLVETWDQQLIGKELLRKEIESVKEEDRQEIQRNMQQLKEEIQAEKNRIHEEKLLRKKDLENQIDLRAKFLDQRQKEMDALNEAFARLNEIEMEKEKQSDYESRLKLKKEMMTYRKYIAELKQKRKEEDAQIEAVLEAHQREIIRKQDEVKCKAKEAKEKLTEEVFAIRAKQLIENKERKEKEKEKEKDVVDFMNKVREMNSCLDKEVDRMKREEKIQYRDDLCKQMEYNNLVKEREKEEMKREQHLIQEEEEKYMAILDKMVQEKIEGGKKHPFREVLEEFECFCRNNDTKSIHT